MTARLATVWDALRSSLWFTPTAMTAGAFLLSLVTVALDESLDTDQIEGIAWIYAGGPEGARAVLSVVAGSMITVAGTIFSITVAALTLASSQFGPRLLRNFMRDRGNQVVLGIFIATFIYCLLVLRIVRSGEDSRVVPHVSVTTGVALGVVSLAALIYFIHHVATSIQAAHVIAAASHELGKAIERQSAAVRDSGPESPATRGSVDTALERLPRSTWIVRTQRSGYVQAVHEEGLVKIAADNDLLIGLTARAGDFLVEGAEVARVVPDAPCSDDVTGRIAACFALGLQRTNVQDLEFGVNQLVEIAVRALSPGVNDPFTAIMCIDRLSDALVRLAQQPEPSVERFDADGSLRVLVRPFSLAGVIDAALNQVRQYGRSSVSVTIRLLEAITVVAAHVRVDGARAALERQARMIARGAADLPEPDDRSDVRKRYEEALAALSARGGPQDH